MQQRLTVSPFLPILSEIDGALKGHLYYLAIAVTLSLPDICVCLACEPDKLWTNQEKYEKWCEEDFTKGFQHLTGRDVYRMRCGVLHQGRFGRPDDKYDRILFTFPESGWQVHDVFVLAPSAAPGSSEEAWTMMLSAFTVPGVIPVKPGEKALILDTLLFCQQMAQSVMRWFDDNSEKPNVKINSGRVVRRRPQFPPYFQGVPVIG